MTLPKDLAEYYFLLDGAGSIVVYQEKDTSWLGVLAFSSDAMAQQFEVLKPGDRPQDPGLDGSALTFEALEHGGEEPDTMPQAIRVTDREGRWCVYVPLKRDGKVVRP